jgi:hypothetical protein
MKALTFSEEITLIATIVYKDFLNMNKLNRLECEGKIIREYTYAQRKQMLDAI